MNQPDKYGAAQQYISDLVFNRWYRFDEIPSEIFSEVFDLIDEGWKWMYFFDDFDESFRKEMPGYINTSRRAGEREKKRYEYQNQQAERYKNALFRIH
ncbi:hypothetical protein KAR91_00320 [Candidatus Pacearchaeota archaeon]|nr:hypothetical protein [Candidatus Pacearchaeota archaeon]